MYLEKLKLSGRQVNSLAENGITSFTKSQMRIVKRINSGQNSAIKIHQNKSKKIAYLTGLIHNIGYAQGIVPRGLVIVPTREDVIELTELAENLSSHTDIRILGVASAMDQTDWIERIEEGIDLVIATPGKLYALFQSNLFKFNDLKHFIVDQTDFLFDLNYQGDLMHSYLEIPAKCQSIYFSQHFFSKAKEWLDGNYEFLDYYSFDEEIDIVEKNWIPQHFYPTPNNHTKVRVLKSLIEDLAPNQKMVILTRSSSAALLVSQYLERNTVGSYGFLHPKHKDNKNQYDTEQFENNMLQIVITPLALLPTVNMTNVHSLLCFDMFLDIDDILNYAEQGERSEDCINIHFGTEEEQESWQNIAPKIGLSFDVQELPEGTLVDEKKLSIIESENLEKAQIFSKGNSLKPKERKFAGPKNTRKVTKFKKKR
jgi:ATP-dependent RNA helicase RhlE